MKFVPELKSGETKRGDCPACGGKNTFVVTKRVGTIMYICHRASCGIRGVVKGQLTIEDVQSAVDKEPVEKVIPNINNINFVNCSLHERAVNWICKNNCEEWWMKNPSSIRYDVKGDRVVFLIEKDWEVIDAVGRYIGKESSEPKWKRYGRSRYPFIAEATAVSSQKLEKKNRTCFVVEDAASACSIARLYSDGIALLGVHAPPEAMLAISDYIKCYVALDRDAVDATYALARKLNQIVDTELLVIDKDLKYYNKEELQDYFKGLD